MDSQKREVNRAQGSVGVRYTQGERWWCELYTLLADRQDRLAAGDISDPRIPEGGTPAYAVWNAAAGAAIARGWDLSLR